MLSNNIYKSAGLLHNKIIAYRRHLHKNPEVHLDMPNTSIYVKEKLKLLGYTPCDCANNGVVAIAGGKKPGKTFLIRADMDALPIREETGLEFQSDNGFMHACGHDMHTAMLLGAAEILKEYEDEIQGNIKLMFQPGEETLAGAKAMVEAGLLSNPSVDAAMMIHVASGIRQPSGVIAVPEGGPGMAASDWLEIHIQGKGGHGAVPQDTVDPINVAAHIHISLQEIISREIDPSDTAVLTVGMIQAGSTNNIIPDCAVMRGTLRTFRKDTREFVSKRLGEISELTAKAFRAKAEVRFTEGCPALVNDGVLAREMHKYLREIIGNKAVDSVVLGGSGKSTGSEDFSYISQAIPAVALTLFAGAPEDGYTYPPHHPKVMFDESALANGAAAYAYVPIKWLIEHI